MESLEIILEDSTFSISRDDLISNCRLFRTHPALLTQPYRIRSSVTSGQLLDFLKSLQCLDIPITTSNAPSLISLCQEFGFRSFETVIRLTLSSHESSARISSLEQQIHELRTEFEKWRQELNPSSQKPITSPHPHKQPSLNGTLSFPFQSDSPLDGIISYLTRVGGGNPAEIGSVIVTSSDSDSDLTYNCKNALNFESMDNFLSDNSPNQWICYDFVNATVKPSQYGIRSGLGGPDWIHLKSWVLEGSVNGNEWIELDRRDNDTHLIECQKSTAFVVENV
jgi:hypothetical protein